MIRKRPAAIAGKKISSLPGVLWKVTAFTVAAVSMVSSAAKKAAGESVGTSVTVELNVIDPALSWVSPCWGYHEPKIVRNERGELGAVKWGQENQTLLKKSTDGGKTWTTTMENVLAGFPEFTHQFFAQTLRTSSGSAARGDTLCALLTNSDSTKSVDGVFRFDLLQLSIKLE